MHSPLRDGAIEKVGRESFGDFNKGADKTLTRAGSTGCTDGLFGRRRTESPLNSRVHSPYESVRSLGSNAFNESVRSMGSNAFNESVRSMGSIPEEGSYLEHHPSGDVLNPQVAASREGNNSPAQQGQAEVATTFCGERLSASGAGSAGVACEAQSEINRLDREFVILHKEMDKLWNQVDQILADQIGRCCSSG